MIRRTTRKQQTTPPSSSSDNKNNGGIINISVGGGASSSSSARKSSSTNKSSSSLPKPILFLVVTALVIAFGSQILLLYTGSGGGESQQQQHVRVGKDGSSSTSETNVQLSVGLTGGGASVEGGGKKAEEASRVLTTNKDCDQKPPASTTKKKQYPHNFPEPPPIDQHCARYHIVFSTDCKLTMQWESYTLFYSLLKVGQVGHVTRIASGCTEDQINTEKHFFETNIRDMMSERFHIHFTPKFSGQVTDEGRKAAGGRGDYKYFNKPFGLKHWFEHSDTMGIDSESGKLLDEDVIVVLVDPDQVFMHPISIDFSDDTIVKISPGQKEGRKYKVEHGTPFAMHYGMGTFDFLDLDKVAGTNSPSKQLSKWEIRRNYVPGPPYIATARDMYAISQTWSDFAPKVHAQHPKLLAEMFAYNVAAAHLQLPHTIVDHLMVSDVTMSAEGWTPIDKIPNEEICTIASNWNPTSANLGKGMNIQMPNILHYCHRYIVDKYFFGKHRIPTNFYTCQYPLFIMPPMDLANPTKYKYMINPDQMKRKGIEKGGQRTPLSAVAVKRTAFMICALTAVMNEANEFFKRNGCVGVKDAVFEKKRDLWELEV